MKNYQEYYIPEIRFKGCKNSWKEIQLKDIIEEYYILAKRGDDYPFLSCGLKGIFLKSEVFEEKTGDFEWSDRKRMVPFAKIVYRDKGDDGRWSFYYQNLVSFGIVNYKYPVFDVKEGIDKFFLIYQMNYSKKFKRKLFLYKDGSEICCLSFRKLKEFNVLKTENEEELKIGQLFNLFDILINNENKQVKILNQTKEFLLSKMLKCDSKFKIPDIRFRNFYIFWKEDKIEKLFNLRSGGGVKKGDVLEEKTKNYKYPVYSAQVINNGIMGYYNSFTDENIITCTIAGNAGVVKYRKGKCYCTNGCVILSQKKEKPNNYLALVLNQIVTKYVVNSVRNNLSLEILKDIKITYSEDELEQQKIGDLFEKLDQLIILHERKGNVLKMLEQGLLQKMFC